MNFHAPTSECPRRLLDHACFVMAKQKSAQRALGHLVFVVAVAQSHLREPGLRSLRRSLRGLAAPRLGRARLGRATTCRFFDPSLERFQ